MSRHVAQHHDARQPYVSFAGPDAVGHGRHSSRVHYQLGKLGEKESQIIVTVTREVIFKYDFGLAKFFYVGPKNSS